eukprot:1858216-Pleurochrysis_carterae.AAC.1
MCDDRVGSRRCATIEWGAAARQEAAVRRRAPACAKRKRRKPGSNEGGIHGRSVRTARSMIATEELDYKGWSEDKCTGRDAGA